MRALTEPLLELDGFSRLLDCVKNKMTPVLASGAVDAAKPHIASALMESLERSAVIITYSEKRAKAICADMEFYCGRAAFYPAKDILFYSADLRSLDIVRERFKALDGLMRGEYRVAVASVEALFDRLVKREIFEKYIIELKEGGILDVPAFFERLVFLGYERTDIVEAAGQFSSRGGIIDIFSPIEDTPFRIELWDDEIDTIKTMSAETQRSGSRIDRIRIFPAVELLYEKEQAAGAAERMRAEYKKARDAFDKNGMTDEAERLYRNVNEAVERLIELGVYKGAGNLMPYFYDETACLLDYLPDDALVFFDEPARIREHADAIEAEYAEGARSRIAMGYMLPSQAGSVYSYEDVLHSAKKRGAISFSAIGRDGGDFDYEEVLELSAKSTESFASRFDLFCNDISRLKNEGYRTLILSNSRTRCERMVDELFQNGVEAALAGDLSALNMKRGSVTIANGRIAGGVSYEGIRLAVFSESEVTGEARRRKKRYKNKKGSPIESFTDLNVGDYVVHDSHGVGVFRGLEKIVVDGVSKDYMKVEYSDGGSLFVPVNQMDMIQKYIGSAPKLNKLGGQDWLRAKAKVRKAVTIMAEDLVQIYAKRQAAQGFEYSRDNLWQKEFEETFPYDETDDQLDAIEDVKRDMQSRKVMDRLICGDVGYGKTEVAIRAAFKAVQDGKQVAFLVPTTILAQQHYNTFAARMKDYPVRVDLYSRFCTAAQQKETRDGLKRGFTDIVIGTHKLLSKDVVFKDLGLIIVDEEQRFGVGHKEKLKALKNTADVLTLTATPIPRTLHMSLSGIRDMSILEEPPQERRPVQTYVMENNPEFIREAVSRELNRGGQVYYLHNRVQSIAEAAHRLQKLVPEANIAYAHGRMSERELESIMEDFIEGEIDVLVCTTIIETGLDIPNVNTIIIQDADRMGLSQLYQLRGRVGRSNRTAYAYLMYKRDKALREEAEKRLQTIREFTELGSGFKIAMRDLEIRGAGNLLGAEQHGHMESVGYDMYCRLLDEEIQKLRGGAQAPPKAEVLVDLNVNAYIPDFYIKNEKLRLEMYKKISSIASEDEYFDVLDELVDRFGELPKSVQTLLEVVLMKSKAEKCGITSMVQKQKSIIITFRPDAAIDPAAFAAMISSNKKRYLFTSSASPYLTVKTEEKDNMNALEYVAEVLNSLLPA